MSQRRSTLGSEYLGDEPADEALGVDQTMERICRALLADSESDNEVRVRTPRIVGVFGHWGSGKTHALNYLGRMLCEKGRNRHPVKVCCFRAWEYEAENDLAAAFVRALVNESNYPWGQPRPTEFSEVLQSGETLRQAAWKLADLVFDIGRCAAVPGVDLIARVGKCLLDLRQTNQQQTPEPVADQIRNTVYELVDRIVPGQGHLFMLVDDLDRCCPPNIVRLFEWFKNHLDSSKCTYVIGLDHRMAAKAIVGQYKDYVQLHGQDALDLDYGFRYLDKLFDLEYELLPNKDAQAMALEKNGLRCASLSEWTRQRISRDFGGKLEMDKLLGLSAVWVPRVMIRTVSTYRMALEALMEQNESDRRLFTNDLPASFPFWLCLLCVLHHLFPPDTVECFVRSDLRSFREKSAIGEALGKTADYSRIDPRLELIQYLNGLQIEPLAPQQMVFLYRSVQDKTPRSFVSRPSGVMAAVGRG